MRSIHQHAPDKQRGHHQQKYQSMTFKLCSLNKNQFLEVKVMVNIDNWSTGTSEFTLSLKEHENNERLFLTIFFSSTHLF